MTYIDFLACKFVFEFVLQKIMDLFIVNLKETDLNVDLKLSILLE